jgi:DNA processing protein
MDHPSYPEAFKRLKNPPYGLFIYGSIHNLKAGLGIVGRREAKTYTLKWMEYHIAPTLKSKKLTVISGGARGVDSKAHKIAMMNDCPTVYVIPSGLLNIYPLQLQHQMQDLVKQGAVFISTYHPESEMEKQNFADRNWLIAALSEKIIILEAQVRSGTYKTAKYALDLGCDLGVVPSFPTDQSYSGSMQLLYDGAQMLRNTEDVQTFIDGI